MSEVERRKCGVGVGWGWGGGGVVTEGGGTTGESYQESIQDCYKSQTCNYTKIKQFPMLVLFLGVSFHFIVTRLIDPTHHRLTVIIQAQQTDTTHSHIILTLHHITPLLNCHIYYLLLVIVGDNSKSTMTSPLFL